MSDIHRENRLQNMHHHEQGRMQFGNAKVLPVTLCLTLFLISGFAHADDNALIREANAALSQKDYNGAFSKFSALAQHGNATAQFNLGAFFLNGQGVQRNEKQAYEWFAKSAAQGNARAMQILQNAAAKGNENAKNELNKIQQPTTSAQTQPPFPSQQASSVPGVEKSLWEEANTALAQKDYNTAFPKFLVLAQQGNAAAQYNVGAFYLNGQGVLKDEKQANDWFAKSAAQGDARAIRVMQNAAAKAKENENAKAKANENAKNTHEELAQFSTGAAPASKPEVKAKANTTTTASHARSKRSGESSDFSLGVSLGATGKLTGINNSPSFGLLAGYKFNSNFGIELAYNMLYRNANADKWISDTYPGTTGTFDLTAISVAGQYTYDLGSDISLLGNFGIHNSSYKIKSTGSGSATGNSTGLVMGIKVQYDLSNNIGIRGGFDTYTESGGMTGDITEVGMAVIGKF